jgi:hypothetical protein
LPAKDNRGQDIVEKRTLPRVVELELLTVRLLPATVFVLAGITKLVDRPGSSTGLAGFGLSPKLAGTLPTAFGGRARGWCRADSGLACRVRLLRGYRPAECIYSRHFRYLSPGPQTGLSLLRSIRFGSRGLADVISRRAYFSSGCVACFSGTSRNRPVPPGANCCRP